MRQNKASPSKKGQNYEKCSTSIDAVAHAPLRYKNTYRAAARHVRHSNCVTSTDRQQHYKRLAKENKTMHTAIPQELALKAKQNPLSQNSLSTSAVTIACARLASTLSIMPASSRMRMPVMA